MSALVRSLARSLALPIGPTGDFVDEVVGLILPRLRARDAERLLGLVGGDSWGSTAVSADSFYVGLDAATMHSGLRPDAGLAVVQQLMVEITQRAGGPLVRRILSAVPELDALSPVETPAPTVREAVSGLGPLRLGHGVQRLEPGRARRTAFARGWQSMAARFHN